MLVITGGRGKFIRRRSREIKVQRKESSSEPRTEQYLEVGDSDLVEVTRTGEGKTKQNKTNKQKKEEMNQKRTKERRGLMHSGDLLQRWDEVSELSQACR